MNYSYALKMNETSIGIQNKWKTNSVKKKLWATPCKKNCW